MKTAATIPAIVLTSIALSGCAMMFHKEQPSNTIQLNYSLTNAAATGLIQAFDMDGNTVLHMTDAEVRKPAVFDVRGQALQYKTMGQYVVLPGTHSLVRIQANGAISEVSRREASPVATSSVTARQQTPAPVTLPPLQSPDAYGKPAPAIASTAPAPVYAEPRTVAYADRRAAPAPVSPYSAYGAKPSLDESVANDELTLIRKELEELKALLSRQRPQPALRAKPAAAQSDITVVSVSFKFNSTSFEPPANLQETLREFAPLADKIAVRGFTDSSQYSQPNLAIATSRAQSARRYLVRTGVEEDRISTSAQANGGFVADNSTNEGRAQNRRVEIEMSLPAKYAAIFSQRMSTVTSSSPANLTAS